MQVTVDVEVVAEHPARDLADARAILARMQAP
jgi:hypothetical protein